MAKKAGRKALPEDQRRISHHFKLTPKVKDLIEKKSKNLGLSKTKYVENLVEDDS